MQSLKKKDSGHFKLDFELQKKWYGRLRRNKRFLILPTLISFLVSLAIGGAGECGSEFLKELNAATVQLLGFTGIILGVAYAAYYSSLAQLNNVSNEIFELHEALGSNQAASVNQQDIAKMQEGLARQQAELAPKIEAMDREFRRSFNALVVSASAFAVLVIVGLFHLQICSWAIISDLFFFCECFLLLFGIEILLLGLFIIVGASEVRAAPT